MKLRFNTKSEVRRHSIIIYLLTYTEKIIFFIQAFFIFDNYMIKQSFVFHVWIINTLILITQRNFLFSGNYS